MYIIGKQGSKARCERRQGFLMCNLMAVTAGADLEGLGEGYNGGQGSSLVSRLRAQGQVPQRPSRVVLHCLLPCTTPHSCSLLLFKSKKFTQQSLYSAELCSTYSDCATTPYTEKHDAFRDTGKTSCLIDLNQT